MRRCAKSVPGKFARCFHPFWGRRIYEDFHDGFRPTVPDDHQRVPDATKPSTSYDWATTGAVFLFEHIFIHNPALSSSTPTCSPLIRSHFGLRLLSFACSMPFNILAFHAPQREHIVAGAGRVTQQETVGHKHIVADTQTQLEATKHSKTHADDCRRRQPNATTRNSTLTDDGRNSCSFGPTCTKTECDFEHETCFVRGCWLRGGVRAIDGGSVADSVTISQARPRHLALCIF